MSALQGADGKTAKAVSGTPDSTNPETPSSDRDPYGLDRIVPSEWVGRAALLAAHLEIASRDDANADEVRQRARELEALLARARDGGFGTILEATVEQTEDEPAERDEPAKRANYKEAPVQARLTLLYLFELDGETVDVIELRPPAFTDVQGVMLGRTGEINLHAAMAGVSVDVLQALRWPDLELVSVVARQLAPPMIPMRRA